MNVAQRIDLTNCDREPIHIPGSIQPHGCLLACDAMARTVLRHSQNASDVLECTGELIGQKLEAILGEDAVHTIRNAMPRSTDASRPALIFGLALPNGLNFDIAVHVYKSTTIIEVEPALADASHPLELARTLIERIISLDTIERLTRDTARLLQALLRYDRVMVYQFAHDGAGKVISESRRGDLESFLGQYFPASDIPQQARALYLRNTIRVISDANCIRIPIIPEIDASGEPLDLSYAHLRSVSPIHCEYLRNMGVGASMSISIIVDGELWGLIACHHYQPRTLTMTERVAAEMFGQFFSLHLSSLRQKQKLQAATRARQSLDRFLRLTARAADISEVLRDNLPEFASLVPCDGVGIWLRGRWYCTGATPPESEIGQLAALAETVTGGRVWATHRLSGYILGADAYADQASGVLMIPLSQQPRDYLFFFRKEIVQTLDWAGNPEKLYQSGPLGDRLTPRKSFAIWKETVRRQSAPWTEAEREIAEATRAALVEVVLHQNELLEDERTKADVRQRMLNEELNHRIKNILAVIRSLVTAPNHAGQNIESYVDTLRGRIQALAYAHDQVSRGDGGGAFGDLLQAELTPYRTAEATIRMEGPPVWLDARAFSVMALVLHELATNAAKYGALSRAGGELAVRWRSSDISGCEIEWVESGGPRVTPPSRRGFGTVLIDRSVPYDLGGDSNLSYLPEGLHASFRIPAKYVAAGSASPARAPRRPQPGEATLAGRDYGEARVLIVEDQMLIAMHLEEILAKAGIRAIDTAGSSVEAMERLRSAAPDMAILDVNLGTETSEAFARELRRRGIPFAFATGYGDTTTVARAFPDAPVVRKPYEAPNIVAALDRLLEMARPQLDSPAP
ncbi:MAG: HWE histidine kinase domain-containing protein [Xanthobacteraceae bacterium]